ncbi:YajQ family cyclic di-GMP-binding protein [Alphaproteobacteria bacterium]|jgi:cyclic-di-GMP-binding protein|nr:YajQ family cyclic di-GMP-binding protein [Alphaproteobacteria bacterium]
MPSFDVVSKTELSNVDNALRGVMKEVGTRYDFKGAACTVERTDESMTILADDDMKLRQMHELIKGYMTRHGVDAGALDFGKVEAASGNSVRQVVTIQQGIDRELAQKITKGIKGSKMKIQVAIQGDELRLSGKKRDDLQEAIAFIKEMDLELPLQYVNFRD